MIEHLRAAWADMTAPGGPFAMSEIVVRGVPMRVFDGAPPNMRTIWEMSAAHADKAYVVYEDERYTYAEIDARVRALAHHLRDDPRRRVAATASPWRCATTRSGSSATGRHVSIGAAVVGMNAWWTTPEMEYGLADSRPKVLIADDERVERVLPVLDGLRADAPTAR